MTKGVAQHFCCENGITYFRGGNGENVAWGGRLTGYVSLLQRGKGFLSWSGTWSWQAAGLERFLSVGGRRGRWWGDAVYMHVKEMETMLLLWFLVWVTSEHSRQECRDGATGCWKSAIVKD